MHSTFFHIYRDLNIYFVGDKYMYIKNKYVSLFYKIIIVIVGIYGLYKSCFFTEKVGLLEHFSYYTNISNLVCIIYFIIYIIKMFVNFNKKVVYNNTLKGTITMAIMITMLVFNFILRPFMTDMDGVMELNSLPNYIVHVIEPLLVIFDYILFDEKGIFKKIDPLKWVIFPFMYWVFICIRAFFASPFTYTSSKYPYFFIDIDMFGIYQVIFNVFLMICAIIILGYMFLFFDRFLLKLSKKHA